MKIFNKKEHWIVAFIVFMTGVILYQPSFALQTIKKLSKQKKYHQDITVGDAVTELKNYLRHLLDKHNLQLNTDEELSLIATTKHLIYLKAGDEDASTPIKIGNLYKIKRSLKGHLQIIYPENFTRKKIKLVAKDDVPLKLAKMTIRETIKDYIINTCGITDPTEVRRLWKSLKQEINRQFDLASFRSDYDEVMVQQKIIGKILQHTYEKLARQGLSPQKKIFQGKIAKKNSPIVKTQPEKKETQRKNKNRYKKRPRSTVMRRRPLHSRKNIPPRISLEKAEAIVAKKLLEEGFSQKDHQFLIKNIMREIKRVIKNGYISLQHLLQITDDMIMQFKKTQKKLFGKKKYKKRISRSQYVHENRIINQQKS